MFWKDLQNFWASRHMTVWADPRDNSVTLSPQLFRHLSSHAPNANPDDVAQVFVFKVAHNGNYGFTAFLPEQPTCICNIQWNELYRSVGFESLCPSVNRIFMDYGLPHDLPRRLRVRLRRSHDMVWYEILKCK